MSSHKRPAPSSKTTCGEIYINVNYSTAKFWKEKENKVNWKDLLGHCFLSIIVMVWFGWVLWHINHCRSFNAKSSLYIYIYIWFGFDYVLWYINHCRLFNAKSSLYIYISYIRFGLVGFYGISTIVGYLMPNFVYKYIKLSKVGDDNRERPFHLLLHPGIGEGVTPFPGLLHFTLDPYLIMPCVEQGSLKYHFLSLCYDSTWDWFIHPDFFVYWALKKALLIFKYSCTKTSCIIL